VEGVYEHRNEPSGSINWEVLDKLQNLQPLEKRSASCSYRLYCVVRLLLWE
jgi:hypothetical protein